MNRSHYKEAFAKLREAITDKDEPRALGIVLAIEEHMGEMYNLADHVEKYCEAVGATRKPRSPSLLARILG